MIVRVGASPVSRHQRNRPKLRGRYEKRHEASGECETLHKAGRRNDGWRLKPRLRACGYKGRLRGLQSALGPSGLSLCKQALRRRSVPRGCLI